MELTDEQQIRNLLYRYMEATDDGDVETRASLFEHAIIKFPNGEIDGREAGEWFGSRQRLYEGIPRTSHVCTNVAIEFDSATKARCRARYLVFQETPDFPLQPIIVGRYHDVLEKVGGAWRFSERRFLIDLVGNMAAHHNEGVTSAAELREQQNTG